MPDQRRVAVANTSPLMYLHQCDIINLLPFRWVRVVRPASIAILPAVSDLGAGEREALALATETPETVVIIDDGLADGTQRSYV